MRDRRMHSTASEKQLQYIVRARLRRFLIDSCNPSINAATMQRRLTADGEVYRVYAEDHAILLVDRNFAIGAQIVKTDLVTA